MNKLSASGMPMRKRVWRLAALALLVGLAIAGCGGQATELPPIPTPTAVPPTPRVVQPTPTARPPTPAPTFAAPTPIFAVSETKDLPYTAPLQAEVPTQKLDVYAPAQAGPWPVVVLVHGFGTTKEDLVNASLAEELAGRGVLVFLPDWRAYVPLEAAENDGLLFREASEELGCAVVFAHARAGDYGGNPGWVTVVAYSTDGAAGMRTALVGDDSEQLWEEFASSRGGPPPQAGCVETGGSAHVDAYVEYGGMYTADEFLKEQDPELWQVCSPYANMGKNPRLLVHLVHGEQDQEVSVDTALDFHEALRGAGYDARVTVINGEHEIPRAGPPREQLIEAIMEAARP